MNRLSHWLLTQQGFFWAFAVALAAKMALAALIPITGDEAYFQVWGLHPDLGFYDHPPMIGWWLALQLPLGDNQVWLRLSAILVPLALGYLSYRLLCHQDEAKARAVALLMLLAPVNLWLPLVATDTPLILFQFLSLFWLYRALQSGLYRHYLLAGLALGLAVLSKYFAVFLGFALFLFWLVHLRQRPVRTGILLMALCTLPFIGLHLWWNYNHCWSNVLFNFVSRNSNESLGMENLFLYLAMLTYLALPILFSLLTSLAKRFRAVREHLGARMLLFGLGVPLGLFLLLSLGKVIGLHWLLGFYPIVFLLAFFLLDLTQLRRNLIWMLLFSLAHGVLLFALALSPASVMRDYLSPHQVNMLTMGQQSQQLVEQLRPYEQQYQIVATSYAQAAILGHYLGKHVPVLGAGSRYGRQDDFITDLSTLAGQDIAIFLARDSSLSQRFAHYFRTSETRFFEIGAGRYQLLLGKGFDFLSYRRQILRPTLLRYYGRPDWLPAGRCAVTERYF